jgi:hypothetical protein
VLLISDIRTANPTTMGYDEHEEYIDKDNELQKGWVQNL